MEPADSAPQGGGSSSSSTAPAAAASWEAVLDSGSLHHGFPDYAQSTGLLDKWRVQYPHLLRKEVVGHSFEGRAIDAYVVGSREATAFEGDTARLLVSSLIHAREYASLTVALYWMGHTLAKYGEDPLVTHLLDTREVWVIPFTNIDAFIANEKDPQQMIRKNRRPTCKKSWSLGGVDLNRNFDFHWHAVGGPCDEEFAGDKPFSEPESRMLRDLVGKYEFSCVSLLHTYGSMLAHPYAYTARHSSLPAEDKAIYDELSASLGFLKSGTIPEILNYTASGEAGDWLYGVRGIISMTLEVGPESGGFQPPKREIAGINSRNFPRLTKLLRVAGLDLQASLQDRGGGEFALLLRNAGLAPGAVFVHFSAPEVTLFGGLDKEDGLAGVYLKRRSDVIAIRGTANGTVSYCATRAHGGCLCGGGLEDVPRHVFAADEPCAAARGVLASRFGGQIRRPFPGAMAGAPPEGLALVGASAAPAATAAAGTAPAHVAAAAPVAAAPAALLLALALWLPVRTCCRRRAGGWGGARRGSGAAASATAGRCEEVSADQEELLGVSDSA